MKKTFTLLTSILLLVFSNHGYGQSHTAKDSVLINRESNYKEAKANLTRILKECPEFNFRGWPLTPDAAAARHKGDEFDCEVCRDSYYQLYAYFLQKAYGGQKYKPKRRRLTRIYSCITEIYAWMRGGNGWGSMEMRSCAYVEYRIYYGEHHNFFKPFYNINGQRSLYIQSVKKYVKDEINANTDLLPREKRHKKYETNKCINKLNKLLTNYFYLVSARDFQHAEYGFVTAKL